ncbi:MAG: sterol desaturase family protein, partial [Bacteroidota bacterium]
MIIAIIPTPLELFLDPVSLCIFAIYLLLMTCEKFFPARNLPVIPNWKIKGLLSYFLFFFISSYLPFYYAEWLPSKPLINLSHFNSTWSAVAGVLLYELGVYIWHRSMHSHSVLWRVFHQLHHSAERLDTFGAFYFS